MPGGAVRCDKIIIEPNPQELMNSTLYVVKGVYLGDVCVVVNSVEQLSELIPLNWLEVVAKGADKALEDYRKKFRERVVFKGAFPELLAWMRQVCSPGCVVEDRHVLKKESSLDEWLDQLRRLYGLRVPA